MEIESKVKGTEEASKLNKFERFKKEWNGKLLE